MVIKIDVSEQLLLNDLKYIYNSNDAIIISSNKVLLWNFSLWVLIKTVRHRFQMYASYVFSLVVRKAFLV